MKLAVISPPDFHHGEEQLVEILFREGLEYFHLRKPGWDQKQLEEYIRRISPAYYKRIIIHSGYGLIKKYNLKGIYIKGALIRKEEGEDIKKIIREAKNRGLWVTSSAHNLVEISQLGKGFDYVFLSPIFDSISKAGYKSNFDITLLKSSIAERKQSAVPIWALGGISSENLTVVLEIGFEGAAVLGAIWEPFSENGQMAALREFRKIKGEWDRIYPTFRN